MFPQLATERFILTQVLPQDQAFLFEALSDPVAMPYNGVYFKTFEETAAQLDWYEKNWTEGTGVSWKIVDKARKENIGVISVYHYKPEHKRAEVGYWLLPRFWGKGIAGEVLGEVIRYWQGKGLHRLEAFVEAGNSGSIRLLERSGFHHEGTLRDYELKWGKFISVHIFALIIAQPKAFDLR